MLEHELHELFMTFLHRAPAPTEVACHLPKDKDLFRNEIAHCIEYTRLQQQKADAKSLSEARLAFLLCGHVRNYNILDFVRRCTYQVDVFIFTWDDYGHKGTEANVQHACTPSSIESVIKQFYAPHTKILEGRTNVSECVF
jgi:hypothetical protein